MNTSMNTISSIPATPPLKAPTRGTESSGDGLTAPADGFAALLDQSMAAPAAPAVETAKRDADAEVDSTDTEPAKPHAASPKTAPVKAPRRSDQAIDLPDAASAIAAAAVARPKRDGGEPSISGEGEDKPGRRAGIKDVPSDGAALPTAALAVPQPLAATAAAPEATTDSERPVAAAKRGAGAKHAADALADATETAARRAIQVPTAEVRAMAQETAAARETRIDPAPRTTTGTEPINSTLPTAAPPATPTSPRPAEATVQAHLAAPVDTPAFAPALATQVRWLVEGGVQLAQLTLNPAEMGPLAVRIAIDGAQARIDFSADVAGTRHAIESALPTLAAALSADGLTLAGGGVYDGAPRRQPGAPGESGAPGAGQRGADERNARADEARHDAAMHALRNGAPARGLVDLMA